jgi:hypothetical protein
MTITGGTPVPLSAAFCGVARPGDECAILDAQFMKKSADATEEKISARLKMTAERGRISCPQALALAEELRVPPSAVGRAANRLGVKIVSCQLGCFR